MNEICPAIETWETGNRWLSKRKRRKKQRRDSADVRTRIKRMESWLLKLENRSHPRILRLYHKMAPTASSASNRSTGTTMEAVPAITETEGMRSRQGILLDKYGLNCVTYCHWKQRTLQALQQFHTCTRSIPQDTWIESHS